LGVALRRRITDLVAKMFQLVVILKGINEVALMALIGQAALFVLAGARRDTNLVYNVLKTVTTPIMKAEMFLHTLHTWSDQH
jgi:hypothetical protein